MKFEEHVSQAFQSIDFVESDLRHALIVANPLEKIIVTDLFKKSVKLRQELYLLQSTFESVDT